MNKFIYSILGTLCITFFLLVSCEKSTESKDKEPPTVSEVKINKRDTILIEKPGTGTGVPAFDTIRVNVWGLGDSELTENEIDTLILGRYLVFTARFQDNESLSSFRLALDQGNPSTSTSDAVVTDEVFWTKKGYSLFSYYQGHVTDTLVDAQETFLVPDSIQGTGEEAGRKLGIREGDYNFRISCMDRAGNETHLETRKIRLLNRRTILKNMGKN